VRKRTAPKGFAIVDFIIDTDMETKDRAERTALRCIPDVYPDGLKHMTDADTERFFFAKGFRLAESETLNMATKWLEDNAHKYIQTVTYKGVDVTGYRTDEMLRDMKEYMLKQMA